MKFFNYTNRNYLYKSLILLYMIPFLLLYACQPCTCEEDSLDGIKGYKPDDKYFKSALVSLHFIMETSPIARVDSLFQQLINVYELPSDASAAKDGVYFGASPYDAFDYRHEVKIEIKDGTITAVDYNEVHKDGIGKQEDEAYCEEMSITGTTPAIAYPEMEQMLLSEQNMMDVDAVSGATYSLYRFRYAVCIALMQPMIEPVTSP
jgi:major membrane immunogen (membrane-anchored lipoprotein)